MEMLLQNNDDLAQVLNSLPVLIFFTDPDGRILWKNKIFRKFFIGLNISGGVNSIGDLFPEDKEEFSRDIHKVASTGEPKYGIIRRIDTAKAGAKTLKFSIIPFNGSGKKNLQILVFGTDITEQADMERLKKDAYDRIEKNIEQFAILGDHLRNPVTAIVGLCDLLDDKTIAQKIIGQAKEIDRIITQIDQGWIESEKVRTVIKKYYDVGVSGTHELVARAIHEEYIFQQKKLGITPETNPSMRPWHELSRHLQDANLKQADDAWKKLQMIHCAIGLAIKPDEPLFRFLPQEIEMLAEHEHQRWMDEKIKMGWKYGPETNDKARIHNCIVPWEVLPDHEREKDRDAVQVLPQILAKVRLKIIRFEEKEPQDYM
jgi:ribosomal protein S13